MEYREVGRSGVSLSVIGFGTAQLQMLPERQAIAAMRRAFELGINWVHTAPDYGGVEHWIARAIRESGEDVAVATQCPAYVDLLEPFFDNARTIFRHDTLDLYGVNCIEDIEYIGENVWGQGGIVDILQRKKREGKVRALFCTTHGPIDYMERLVRCGVFDAVMVDYNPLEFHLLSYYAARIGRRFENLRDVRERLFPLAAARGVSVIVMKPLAAGLLSRGRAAKAKGCRVWDPEGNEFIDYTMGWGSTILGYADERIQQAIGEHLSTAPLAPFPDPLEMEVSEMIAEDFPSAEMVAFGKNGSDACTVAARLARITTGRRQILSCGFHGWQDFAVEPTGELHKFRFNSEASFRALYDRHRADLAAIMIEPAGPFVSPDEGLAGDADPEFLGLLAQAARDAGALLVFDEIITGYRYPGGGVQQATAVIPDLTCLGKALASGMPLSAVAGRGSIFHAGFARTQYCPTFKAEIYSLAAARAAIAIYRREPVAQWIWRTGNQLKEGIVALCRELTIPGACQGPPFRFSLVFEEPDPVRRRLARTLYMQELLGAGLVTVSGVMLPSMAHSDDVVAETLRRMRDVLTVMADAWRLGDFDRRIEIPLL